MDDETWWKNDDRLKQISDHVSTFHGWHDDTPHLAKELKVVNITAEVYDREIYSSKTPWIMSVIPRRARRDEHDVHSEQLFENLKILSDEYKGKVRFGVVDGEKDETIRFMFETYVHPKTFYIVDNQVYEMMTLATDYDNVRSFIEKEYLDAEKR